MKRLDLKNKRFGRVVVLRPVKSMNHRSRWSCVCDCGVAFDTDTDNLVRGYTKSCGCFRKDAAGDRMRAKKIKRLKDERKKSL